MYVDVSDSLEENSWARPSFTKACGDECLWEGFVMKRKCVHDDHNKRKNMSDAWDNLRLV